MLVRMLCVEDVETDAELVVLRLRQDGIQCDSTRVETDEAFVAALRERKYDVILSDFSLPQFDGMSALALASREVPDIPFIFVSGVFSIAQRAEEDSSVTGRVLRTGEVFLCNDIAHADETIAAFPALRNASFQSIVALPLTVDGTTVGAMTLTAQDSNAITDEELALLGEVAANLSFALQYFEKENAVQFLSFFDSLTDLAKRVLFCERLASRLTARKAEEPQAAVAVLDVEHLSIINDSYGRHAGDHLLQRIAASTWRSPKAC
ncbi:MAG: hypothetical protein JWO04_1184 [Gammaproteobacteria bacterium]|jgi:PleD family two-component response regulator|nr:hypothetical protein [Gammaproteobacteria bacterium]